MSYEIEKFDYLLSLPGFSDQLLKNHFTLYDGYVANTNKLLDLLGTKELESPEYAELQRRLGWEWNGMRLHELYFENLSPQPKLFPEDSELKKEIERTYGSLENWKKIFSSLGTMRGIGWVVLYYDKEFKELFNVWIGEHDSGHLAGAMPLLVMDVFEHAYMPDYQLKKADYVQAFLKAVDWEKVEERFENNL